LITGSGHNRPVELTFQFLLVGRLAIELTGRYSASKLMSALAQPGHYAQFPVMNSCGAGRGIA
jgi:hypothetical protein